MQDKKIPLFYICIFKPGKKILHNGIEYVVESVHINGYNLTVKFKDHTMMYDSETIPCEPDLINFNRK